MTPDRIDTEPESTFEGEMEAREKASQLVKEARKKLEKEKCGKESYTGYFGGLVLWKQELRYCELLLDRCEDIEIAVNDYWDKQK